MAEALVDIAPNVSVYLANPSSFEDLRSTALWMVAQGVTVINMSLAWTWEGPGDGTGFFTNGVLETVALSVQSGVTWINSAGNYANSNWYGAYADADGDAKIEFDTGVENNTVNLDAGEKITVQGRWDDSWTNASRDLDLYLRDSGLNVVAFSEDQQAGLTNEVPREILFYTAVSAGTYSLSVQRFGGSIPSWVQLNLFTQQTLGTITPDHSLASPSDSAVSGFLAVGAASWSTPTVIEPFSSQGPTTDGRTKPDITGADRGDSASSGVFAGTSQASPHVAGLAALVQQHSPELTPAVVANFLTTNALPRGAVPNNTWGYGFARLPTLTPGIPADIVTVPGNSEAAVSWSAPPDGGSPITGYTVESSTGGHTAAVDGQTFTADVTSLTNGTAYTFTVTAENSVGQGDPSPASQAVTPQGPPGPPIGVVAVPGNATALVTWNLPASDGGSTITQFEVASDPAGQGATVDGSTLEATVSGLTNGVPYGFVVTASNEIGTGPRSATSTPVVPKSPPGPPLSATATPGEGQAIINWSPPATDGGSPITQYTVTLTPGDHSVEVDGLTLSATVAGLDNGTPYLFSITATNSAGTGGPSESMGTVTPFTPTPPPVVVVNAPSLSQGAFIGLAMLLAAVLLGTYAVSRTARQDG